MPAVELDPRASLRAALAAVEPPLATPALVIDLDAVDRNVAALRACCGARTRWRPHVKTVKQSAVIARLLAAGVRTFKCATAAELALVLATADAAELTVDVLWAYPIGRAGVAELAELLARRPGHVVGVLADDADHLAWLDRACPDAVRLWPDVDVGMHRTGSPPQHWHAHAAAIAAITHPLGGLHGYEGHVALDDHAGARRAHTALAELARSLDPVPAVVHTSGSLALFDAIASVELHDPRWIHEIGSGTLVLVDVASAAAGARVGAVPAAFVAARVIARPGDDRVTLDAGSKAITPDRGAPSCLVLGHPELVAQPASEEHLPCAIRPGHAGALGRDDLVLLVPDHVCTTVNLHRHAILVRGDQPIGTAAIEASGRIAAPEIP